MAVFVRQLPRLRRCFAAWRLLRAAGAERRLQAQAARVSEAEERAQRLLADRQQLGGVTQRLHGAPLLRCSCELQPARELLHQAGTCTEHPVVCLCE